ncbi:MAG: methylenetetrahydrofolate--tRNA-(uracil(54)-C(5))-methyltransferase (FADH(2)-oxidizing) TrmFO [Myxococcota bacterium]
MTGARAGGASSAIEPVTVIGAGLAGCEAAWQLARRGVPVRLHEMKPERMSPAHGSPDFAELVCSNSLRSNQLGNAVGLLKEEMRRLDSLVLGAADGHAVPAGRALAVDRTGFARQVTETVLGLPGVEVRYGVVERIPEAGRVILATGPLTAPELAEDLKRLLGEEYLYFYDAIAPTVYADSIDHEVVFRASRYEDGDGDYLNVPLDRDEYAAFVDALLAAETVPLHPHEARLFFEGCLPVEEMARRGPETLAHGPLKPVGLVDPRTGRRPHAVVQLRQEDKAGVLFNLVGFQTKLRIAEQQKLIRSLPGLSGAVFARYGSVHRNTYVNAPRRLTPSLELRARPGAFLAGQLAGVEGYVESAALGLLAGVHAARAVLGLPFAAPPAETAHGALVRYLMESDPDRFQPSNVNYGLFPPLEGAPRGRRKWPKREKNQRLAERALEALARFSADVAPVSSASGAS